jgi:hypothetical protein
MAAARGARQATLILVFPGWSWKSYTGTAPAALVALDSQVFFSGDVSKGFRFSLTATPGTHELTVILAGHSRTVTIEVEAGVTYEYPLKFGGRWGALKVEFPAPIEEAEGGPT